MEFWLVLLLLCLQIFSDLNLVHSPHSGVQWFTVSPSFLIIGFMGLTRKLLLNKVALLG